MVKMIVGLGNPGDRYENTKHNMGFMTVDLLAQSLGLGFSLEKTFIAEISQTFFHQEKIFLVKPQTFMNESGRSIKPLLTYYNLTPGDLLVITDDLDSPIGRVRLRAQGSSGGQKGLKSLMVHLGTEEFKRIKIGIGRPKGGKTVPNHVLSKFDKRDEDQAREGIYKARDACLYYLETGDFTASMNKFNGN